MFDIITFGSATWDVFLKPRKFQALKNKKFLSGKGICFNLGSKVDVEDIYLFSGGGGSNTAATFAKQGFRVAYFGTIGNDLAGQEIIKELKKLDIDCQFVSKTDLKTTNHSVIFNTGPKKDRTVLAYRGASELLGKKDIPWSKLKAKWFYLAPLSGKLCKITKDIVNFAVKRKIKIALNPGNCQLSLPKATLKAILKKVDVLVLNQEEASLLTKIPYQRKKGMFKKTDEMCPGITIITFPREVNVSDGKYLYKAKAPIVKVVDKTGAGDSFASGFVSGLITKGSIEYAIQMGVANSISCIQKWGAKNGLLKKNEKFKKVKVTKKKL